MVARIQVHFRAFRNFFKYTSYREIHENCEKIQKSTEIYIYSRHRYNNPYCGTFKDLNCSSFAICMHAIAILEGKTEQKKVGTSL